MDHEQASAAFTAERYLLDELKPEERDEFEEHYFSCPECADAVRTGAIFVENAGQAGKEQPRRPNIPGQVTPIRTSSGRVATSSWLAPAMAAAAVLLFVVGYQNTILIPNLQKQAAEWASPRPLAAVLLRPQSRSERPEVEAHGEPLGITIELNAERLAPNYDITIQNGAEQSVAHFTSRPAKDGTIQIIWPSPKIDSGDYKLVVREPSPSNKVVDTYAFHFQK